MGSSPKNKASEIARAELDIRNAQNDIKCCKANIEYAKQSGNYYTAAKNNCLPGGRRLNLYDLKLYNAQQRLEKAKEKLARAKKIK